MILVNFIGHVVWNGVKDELMVQEFHDWQGFWDIYHMRNLLIDNVHKSILGLTIFSKTKPWVCKCILKSDVVGYDGWFTWFYIDYCMSISWAKLFGLFC